MAANKGCTAKAIELKSVQILNNGEMDPLFDPEIDSASGTGIIKNMLVGPIYDSDGTLRGVLQLFNKISPEENNCITKRDVTEVNTILGALGEVIKSADLKYEFEKTCNLMYKNIANLRQEFEIRLDKEFLQDHSANRNLYSIMHSFDNIDEKVHELIKHKSEYVFSGDQITLQKVFKSLGIDANKARKKKVIKDDVDDPDSEVSKAIAKLAKNIPPK